MIKLINVSKKYGKKLLFEDVNIEINKAGIYSFIGENGIGKTTILNIISKFIKPTKGKAINKEKICFISQKVNLISYLKIREHFEIFNVSVNHLKKVRLYNKLENYPNQLSQGQKQRVACILSLYSDSTVIICDEPTSHLDNKSAEVIAKELIKVSKKKIVLLVSHDMDLINKYSDVIYKINDCKLEIVKKEELNKKVESIEHKKIKLNKCIKHSIRFNIKINILFQSIMLITYLLLFCGIHFKDNVENILNKNIDYSLDYNKFYLKQCKQIKKDIVFKECSNLEEEKINILKESGHLLAYNYDLLLNSLYNTSSFNIINPNKYLLREGTYPSSYNEIIADDSYNIGDVITLKTSFPLTIYKTDIYNNTLNLIVVGITEKSFLLNKESFFVDYSLIEEYLKKEYLINNKKTLFDYFETSEFNDYKYVLYFNDIDTKILNDNNIEYISSSYDYYKSLEEIVEKINQCLLYLNVVLVSFTTYYTIKLIKKKLVLKEDEIRFLKSMGVSEKKVVKMISKEQNKLVFKPIIISLFIMVCVFYAIFKDVYLNLFAIFACYILSHLFNKSVVKKIVRKRKIV